MTNSPSERSQKPEVPRLEDREQTLLGLKFGRPSRSSRMPFFEKAGDFALVGANDLIDRLASENGVWAVYAKICELFEQARATGIHPQRIALDLRAWRELQNKLKEAGRYAELEELQGICRPLERDLCQRLTTNHPRFLDVIVVVVSAKYATVQFTQETWHFYEPPSDGGGQDGSPHPSDPTPDESSDLELDDEQPTSQQPPASRDELEQALFERNQLINWLIFVVAVETLLLLAFLIWYDSNSDGDSSASAAEVLDPNDASGFGQDGDDRVASTGIADSDGVALLAVGQYYDVSPLLTSLAQEGEQAVTQEATAQHSDEPLVPEATDSEASKEGSESSVAGLSLSTLGSDSSEIAFTPIPFFEAIDNVFIPTKVVPNTPDISVNPVVEIVTSILEEPIEDWSSVPSDNEQRDSEGEEPSILPTTGGGDGPDTPPTTRGGEDPSVPPTNGGDGPETPPTNGGGSETPPTNGGDGPETPPTDGGDGPETPPTDGGDGSETPPTNGGDGPDTPPTNGGDGPETPPTNGGDGPETPPTNGGEDPSVPPTNGGDGPETPPTNGGDGPETPPTNGGDGPETPPTNGGGSETPPTNGGDGPDTPPTNGGDGPDTPPTNGGDGPDAPPTNGGDGPETPPTNGGDGPDTPPTNGGGSETPPTNGGGSETPPTNGGGSETPPTNGGDGPDTPPTNGGEDPSVPPTNGGEDPSVPPTNGGDGPETPPTNGGDGPETPPTNGGEDPSVPPTNGGGELPVTSIDASGGNQVIEIFENPTGKLIIDHFGGIGRDTSPSVETLAEADTIAFTDVSIQAQDLSLTQIGDDLKITLQGSSDFEIWLTNFELENLDNLTQATTATVNFANLLFGGTVADSFDVFNAEWQNRQVFNANSVTFANALNNSITGLENSADQIDGQGGDDILTGLSGDDILLGGDGDDTLIGGTGFNVLEGGSGSDRFHLDLDGHAFIRDFVVGEDVLYLPSAASFDELTFEVGASSDDSQFLATKIFYQGRAIADIAGLISVTELETSTQPLSDPV